MAVLSSLRPVFVFLISVSKGCSETRSPPQGGRTRGQLPGAMSPVCWGAEMAGFELDPKAGLRKEPGRRCWVVEPAGICAAAVLCSQPLSCTDVPAAGEHTQQRCETPRERELQSWPLQKSPKLTSVLSVLPGLDTEEAKFISAMGWLPFSKEPGVCFICPGTWSRAKAFSCRAAARPVPWRDPQITKRALWSPCAG